MLLVLVIAVWGTIAYKIIVALNPDIPEFQPQEFVTKSNYKVETSIDTFSITKVNRDPFLGTYSKKEESPKKATTKKKPISWLPIQYHGIIKNGGNEMYIVSINGKQHLLKKGQARDSIQLLYGNVKSITMRYKNTSKIFKLKQ